MAFSYFLCTFFVLAMVIPTESIFFGGGGGGQCCGGCGGRKKRSTEDMEKDRFQAEHSDKLCNNPELKRFIRQNMVADPMQIEGES
ncbi:hypothetical protein COOONC_19997 [Cooperia oncophora]